MAAKKLSEITALGSKPALTDQLVAVIGGNLDRLVNVKDVGGRQILTADRTYNVATTGNDSNDGIINPWLTVQHALNFIAENLDIASFQVFVNVGAGTFDSVVHVPSMVGGGIVQVNGAGSSSTTMGAVLFGVNNVTTVAFNKIKLTSGGDVFSMNATASGGVGDATTVGAANDVEITTTGGGFDFHAESYNSNISMSFGIVTGSFVTKGHGGLGMVFCEFGSAFTFTGTWVISLSNPLSDGWVSAGVRLDTAGVFVNNAGNWTGAATGFRNLCHSNSNFSDDTFSGIYQVPGDAPAAGAPAIYTDGTSFFLDVAFKNSSTTPGNSQHVDTDYTLQGPRLAPDLFSINIMQSAAPHTLTVPSMSTLGVDAFPVGVEIQVLQTGTGAVTIAAGAGVTGHNFGVIPGGQWGGVTLAQINIDEWVMVTGF